MTDLRSLIRWTAVAIGALWLGACTGTGINAGEDGGLAFIVFTAMLLLALAILYIALGRDD